jgi:acyl carrier protein
MRIGSMETVKRDIKEFVISNFLFGQKDHALSDEESFLESGIIDSTGVLELVAFLEQNFGIAVADRELLPENLDSVRKAAALSVLLHGAHDALELPGGRRASPTGADA